MPPKKKVYLDNKVGNKVLENKIFQCFEGGKFPKICKQPAFIKKIRVKSVFSRIHPYHYIHVLDQTSNVTRVEIGPQTFIRKDNEKVLLAPTKMVIVPPGTYCSITNPAKKDKNGEPVKDTLNQVNIQLKIFCNMI